MTRTDLSNANAARLAETSASLAAAFGETVGTLIDRNLKVEQGTLDLLPMPDLLGSLTRPCEVLRGVFDREFGGKNLLVLLEVQDAAAIAGLLLMTPHEEIEARRTKDSLEPNDLEAMAEVGTVVCTRFDQVLRESLGRAVGLKFKDHAVVRTGTEADQPMEVAEVVCFQFRIGFADYPEMTVRVLLDPETATTINAAPLLANDIPAEQDEGLQGIPAAPIRGVLNAYLCSNEPYSVIRRACRRVGLELQRHSRVQVPNPAAHKDSFVLMDVPPGEERRFDWAKRLKDFEANIKVVLIIHRPSRARVLQGFIAEADVILGWPLEEAQLSQKLEAVLQREESEVQQ